jgi:hypothetical protein
VSAAIRTDRLHFADSRWLRTLQTGADLLIILLLASPVLGTAGQRLLPVCVRESPLAPVVLPFTGLCLVAWFLTAPEPDHARSRWCVRRLSRGAALLAVTTTLLVFVLGAVGCSVGNAAMRYVVVVADLGALAALFMLMSRMAWRVDDMIAVIYARWLALAIAFAVPAGMGGLILGLPPTPFIIALTGLIGYGLGLWLAVRCSYRINRALRFAKARRASDASAAPSGRHPMFDRWCSPR